jgi:hypothetical protein
VGIQRANLLIAGDRRAVIDEHTHTHTPIACPDQGIGEQPTRFVAAKDEILKIQGFLCGIDHLRASQKSIDSDGDDAKCGIAVSPARGAVKLRAQARDLRMSKRDG